MIYRCPIYSPLPVEVSFDFLKGDFEWAWKRARATYIAKGRNSLVNNLSSDAVYQCVDGLWDYICMCDADTSGFEKDRIIERLIAHDKDIVGAAYVERKNQECYCAGELPKPPYYAPGAFVSRSTRGLINVPWTGTGLLLIKRHVFEKVAYPWFQFREIYYTNKKGEKCVREEPEDMSFCRKAREAGFEVYLDCDCVVTHNLKNLPINLEGHMSSISLRRIEAKNVFIGLQKITELKLKNKELNYAVSRCKRTLQSAVEAIEEAEDASEGIKAYREELKKEKVLDGMGGITDPTKYIAISEKHREALDKNKQWLRQKDSFEVFTVKYEYTGDVPSDLFDLIFPIIEGPDPKTSDAVAAPTEAAPAATLQK